MLNHMSGEGFFWEQELLWRLAVLRDPIFNPIPRDAILTADETVLQKV